MNKLLGRIASQLTNRTRSSHREELWTKDFVLNLLTTQFIFAGYSSTLTIVPAFAIDLGGDPALHLPIIVGAFGIVGIFIRPFGGQWVYVLGPKRVALIGAIIVALGSLACMFAPSPWWLIPMRTLQGIGLALGPLATWTIAANIAPPTRRAEAMSYTGNSIGIAFLYAPFVASFLYDEAGANEAFVFSALSAAVAIATCLLMSADRIGFQHSPSSGTASDEGRKPPLVARSAIFPTLILLSYTFTTAPASTYLPLLTEEKNLGNPGLFYTVFSLVSMCAMAAAGPIADRFGRATVIVPGMVLVALGMFVVNASSVQVILLSGGLLAGMGAGMLQPGLQSLTVDRAPMRERSAAMATLQQAWDVGGSFGAFAIGPAQGYIGTANTFGLTGIVALIGALGFIIGNAKSPTKLPE